MANRKTPFTREPREDLEDLRDDTIAVFLNSGMTMAQVHANGGPTPQTLSKWLYKETRFPLLDTILSVLRICGYDFAIVPKREARRVSKSHSAVLRGRRAAMPKKKVRYART